MAVSTYAELQSAWDNWAETSDTTERKKEGIAFAEARLNRKIPAVEVDAALTGTESSRDISVSALSIERPITLFLTNDDGGEVPLVKKSLGTMPFDDDNAEPAEWVYDVDDAKIVLNCPCDEAYTFRLVYRERFALSDSATTNWLLTNHPDVYFAAMMMWGAGYREDTQMGAIWKGILDEAIPEIRRSIAQGKAGVLTHDPALVSRWPYRGVNLEGNV